MAHPVEMDEPMPRRSVLGVAILSWMFSVIYAPWWVGEVAEDLDKRYGSDLGNPWTSRFDLKTWARAVSNATGGKISPRAVMVHVVLFPVGLPLLQHHLNRAQHALPPARALRSDR